MPRMAPWNADVKVSPTEAEAAESCARFIAGELEKALGFYPEAMFAVSGGASPRAMFGHLARMPVDWSRVHIFWVDERCVPPDDPASNYRMAMETLIGPAGIPANNVHRVRTELGPEEAAKAYTEEIERVCGDGMVSKRFHVMHRGIGTDGHTASLFPGDPLVMRPDGTMAAVFVPKFDQWRVTMTPASLEDAADTAVFAPGPDKAAVVARILEGDYDPMVTPAQIATRGGVIETWFLDAGSAAMLSDETLPVIRDS